MLKLQFVVLLNRGLSLSSAVMLSMINAAGMLLSTRKDVESQAGLSIFLASIDSENDLNFAFHSCFRWFLRPCTPLSQFRFFTLYALTNRMAQVCRSGV